MAQLTVASPQVKLPNGDALKMRPPSAAVAVTSAAALQCRQVQFLSQSEAPAQLYYQSLLTGKAEADFVFLPQGSHSSGVQQLMQQVQQLTLDKEDLVKRVWMLQRLVDAHNFMAVSNQVQKLSAACSGQ